MSTETLAPPEPIDLLIVGTQVVTMNDARDIIRDGAVAVRGSTIVDVGKASDLPASLRAGADHRR